MDKSHTATVFMSRQRESMPLRNALIHLALVKEIDRSELSIYEAISEAIKPDSAHAYKIDFKDIKNTGIRSYLVELGRGITMRSGAMISSGYFNDSAKGKQLEKESVYLLTNTMVSQDMAAKILSTQVAKEMVKTIAAMDSSSEVKREVERHATSAILELPNGERLIQSELSNELSPH